MSDQVDGIWRAENEGPGRWLVCRYTMEGSRPFRWVDSETIRGRIIPTVHRLMDPAVDRARVLNEEAE